MSEIVKQEKSLSTGAEMGMVDLQISTAKQYPRNIMQFVENCEAMVRMDEDVAKDCIYSLSKGGSDIQGASVRLAEILLSEYGNLRVQVEGLGYSNGQVHAKAACFDVEKNIAVSVTESRRATYKNGSKYSDDMIQTLQKAANAIAKRNAIFEVIPKAYVNRVYQVAVDKINGKYDGEDTKLSEAVDKALSMFESLGIEESLILGYFNVTKREFITDKNLAMLRVLYKDGQKDPSKLDVLKPIQPDVNTEAQTLEIGGDA